MSEDQQIEDLKTVTEMQVVYRLLTASIMCYQSLEKERGGWTQDIIDMLTRDLFHKLVDACYAECPGTIVPEVLALMRDAMSEENDE